MAEGPFVGAVLFLDKLGVYDVVLPFLLVFTIVFAILEKTKVLGTEMVGSEELPRRNLNSMAAFVIGFLVIASSTLVASISAIMAKMVLLLALMISILMLLGSFEDPSKMKKGFFLKGKTKGWFIGLMIFGMSIIFFDSMTFDGNTWLEIAFGFLAEYWDNSFVGTIVLLGIIGGFILWVTKGDGDSKASTPTAEDDDADGR